MLWATHTHTHTHAPCSIFKNTIRRRNAWAPELNVPKKPKSIILLFTLIYCHSYFAWPCWNTAGENFPEIPGEDAMPARGASVRVWLGGGDSSFLLWRDLCPSSELSTSVEWCIFLHIYIPFLYQVFTLLPWSFGSQETIKRSAIIIISFPLFLSHWISTGASPPVHISSNLLFSFSVGFSLHLNSSLINSIIETQDK